MEQLNGPIMLGSPLSCENLRESSLDGTICCSVAAVSTFSSSFYERCKQLQHDVKRVKKLIENDGKKIYIGKMQTTSESLMSEQFTVIFFTNVLLILAPPLIRAHEGNPLEYKYSDGVLHPRSTN